MDLSEQNRKAHVPGYPKPDPSLSDSSLNKSNLSNYSNSGKSIKKKSYTKKKRQKHKEQDVSDWSLSDSDSSNDSDYGTSRRKKMIYQKKDPIKLCERLTETLLMAVYKLNIIRFKIDEDPLQSQIYSLTFIESL